MLLRIKNKTLVALLSTLLKLANCQILNNFLREIQTKHLKELIYQNYQDYNKIYGKCYIKNSFGNSNIDIIQEFWDKFPGNTDDKIQFFLMDINKNRHDIDGRFRSFYDKIKEKSFIIEIAFYAYFLI